ncbi:hypothetical protein F3Y22_tig00111002pilonHSYRG00102 [Hibiscus syriacus]|uniref:EMC1 first beta-propeller domain-containing protein n=1 Tax=Hibiscus syriacus TaxID=106335 RepID=A0A6A2Z957_HIBSY|nr:hypothetical protein F3Y22_tig00111002pilonHSYRG00102 [Hibiscus syriacus]
MEVLQLAEISGSIMINSSPTPLLWLETSLNALGLGNFAGFLMVLWNIWNARNTVVHSGRHQPSWILVSNARLLHNDFLVANFASRHQANRGHQDEVRGGTTIPIAGCLDPGLIEIHGLAAAVNLARDKGWQNFGHMCLGLMMLLMVLILLSENLSLLFHRKEEFYEHGTFLMDRWCGNLHFMTNLIIERNNVVVIFSNGRLHAVSCIDGEVLWNKDFEAERNGKLLKHERAAFSGGFSGQVSLVSSETLVTLDSTGTCGLFAIRMNAVTIFIRAIGNGMLEVVEKADRETAVGDALSISEGQQEFALVQHVGSDIHLTVKLLHDWDGDLLKESIKIYQQRGLIHKVFINNYVRTERSHGFWALIVMEDHSLLLLQQGTMVWNMEDGMASIIDVTTSELPVERAGVSVAKVELNLFEWLKKGLPIVKASYIHYLKAVLKGTLMLASPEDIAAIQYKRLKSSEKSKMTQNHNGFRKLIIVLTRAGKLFALHTGDGRIVWSRLLQSLSKSEACQHPIGLVSVAGKEVSSSNLNHSIVRVIPLPFNDSTEQRLHLLIDADKNAHVYPKTPEAIGIVRREFLNIYWYSVEDDNGIIKGLKVKDGLLPLVHVLLYYLNVYWCGVVNVACTYNQIECLQAVHTQAKLIAADQDAMYKYISRNLLFVATVAPKASGEIGSVTPEESWLVIYLIDTVTGRVLHRMLIMVHMSL